MKVRFQVEHTLKFTDFVEMEVSYIDDESKDEEVKEIAIARDLRNKAFEWEEVEIVDVVAID
jgi:hypothetical protein